MHENVKTRVAEILSGIPTDTGLTEDEVLLELATRIVEKFPRGTHPDADTNLNDATDALQEAGTYISGTLHPEDLVKR